jgi:hypothetical protein
VKPTTLTRTFRNREVSIARQIIEAGAPPGEPRQFVAWYRECHRAMPPDMRVYESRRGAFLAGIRPAPPGRNGRAEPERRTVDHTGCPAGCTKDHRDDR